MSSASSVRLLAYLNHEGHQVIVADPLIGTDESCNFTLFRITGHHNVLPRPISFGSFPLILDLLRDGHFKAPNFQTPEIYSVQSANSRHDLLLNLGLIPENLRPATKQVTEAIGTFDGRFIIFCYDRQAIQMAFPMPAPMAFWFWPAKFRQVYVPVPCQTGQESLDLTLFLGIGAKLDGQATEIQERHHIPRALAGVIPTSYRTLVGTSANHPCYSFRESQIRQDDLHL